MQVLVLGSEGMLGHKMLQTLLKAYPNTKGTIHGSFDKSPEAIKSLFDHNTLIEKVDAMDLQALDLLLSELKPKYIVNCIGIIKQRDLSFSAIPSIMLNSLLPHKLADIARKWNGRVIHFSTDCVFNGKNGNYTEESISDAEDLYGKSKYLGEVADENALTLRTSIIGREIANYRSLLDWFLSQEGKEIKGFRKVIYSGVTTNYMANLVTKLINEHPTLSGLYQVTSPPISKYDLLMQIKEAFGLNITIRADDHEISDRSMIGEKFVQKTGYTLPSWDYLIQELVADQTPYQEWKKIND